MRKHVATALAIACIALVAAPSLATTRYYPDIVAHSPNKRYRVDAKSPDNRGIVRMGFESNFTYRCIDTKTKQTLWTRKQPMGKPVVLDDGPEIASPKEASPIAIFVDDSAWVVIRTGWDELIAVDPKGRDRCKIELLSEVMSIEDRRKHVHETTAGPIWSGNSLWYFVDTHDTKLFVIRPWWGNRMVVDIVQGKVKKQDEKLRQLLLKKERDSALKDLQKGVKNRKKWEGDGCCEALWPVLEAAYLVGKFRVKEAVPYLRKLEDANFIGSSVSGGSDYEPKEGEVDPAEWEEFTIRQVVHVSLRRLGEKPGPYPCTRFDIHFEDYRRERPYTTPKLKHPRLEGLPKLAKEMKPEEVLGLVGAPDFVDSGVWYYDMDSDKPFTLVLRWGAEGLADIKQHTPPFWKTEKWDEEIAFP